MTGDWKQKVCRRIRTVSQMIVLCGTHTDTATGVSVEVGIAQEEKVTYFLLWRRKGKTCKKPRAAKASDKIYEWTWENLKKLIGGAQ